MTVPLSEIHPDVRAVVRALIDEYGPLGIINIITQLVEMDKALAELYPEYSRSSPEHHEQ